MRILIAIPHIFAPRESSEYSSEKEAKRETKKKAIYSTAVCNKSTHGKSAWIHASKGKEKEVVTRKIGVTTGHEIDVLVVTSAGCSLLEGEERRIRVMEISIENLRDIAMVAMKECLDRAHEYDMVCYLEDDISIEDRDIFDKIRYLVERFGDEYVFMPHRCEMLENGEDVLLSGDPDGGRPDLFWDTGEEISLQWPLGEIYFYRATNPHSGCFFLTRSQAAKIKRFWEAREWRPDFRLAGPLEQAATGFLLPYCKVMKTRPSYYRFLMVRHRDTLWKRHRFEVEESLF